MRSRNSSRFVWAIVLCVAVMGLAAVYAQAAGDYSFKVTNTTQTAIKQVLVSENGKKWGQFDIGSGIKAGSTVTLVWAQSTNNEECTQYVKAVFSDGSESEPAKFDFCEKNLELEF